MSSSKKRKSEINKNRRRKEKNRKEKKFKPTILKPFSFFDSPIQYNSDKKIFGLCDKEPPPHLPAYLDEHNGREWIAVVENSHQNPVRFVALDNSIELLRPDGKSQDKCCDGMLTYHSTLIFVELTTRSDKKFREEKDKQLRATIKHFENTKESDQYKVKRAYIANNRHPKFKTSYGIRADRFFSDTGYVLRIQNRIEII